MTPIAEVRIPVTLDRERTMIFNLNTMAAYEEASGKFYWDTIYSLIQTQAKVVAKAYASWQSAHPNEDPPSEGIVFSNLDVIRELPMKDLRAIVWAATHEYQKDEPVWPLKLSQVGRYFTPLRAIEILKLVVAGHNLNAPTKQELGEVSGPVPTGPALVEPAQKPSANGGAASIDLPADAFA